MVKIGCFNDVLSFWQVCKAIKLFDIDQYFFNYATKNYPTYMINGQERRINTFALFKTGINPVYEDPKNEQGGEYLITI